MWRAISGYTDCPSVVVRTSGNRSFLLIQFPFPILCLIFFNCLVSCLFCFAQHVQFSFRTGSVAETIMAELVVWPKRTAPERYRMHWHVRVVTGSTPGRRKLRISQQFWCFQHFYWPKHLPFLLHHVHRLPFYIWISETNYAIGKLRVNPLLSLKVRNQPKLRRVTNYSHFRHFVPQ